MKILLHRRRTLLSCIISIFLCAAFSANGQSREEWLLKAVECERIVFEGDPLQVDSALVQKAFCQKQAGEYAAAVQTLERVQMYRLLPEEQKEVLAQKELCSLLAGDYAAAASYMDEAASDVKTTVDTMVMIANGRMPEVVKFKKQGTVLALSFLPPLGHFYTGNYGEGLLSLGLNALSVSFTAYNIIDKCYVVGLLGGGMALNYTYMGNFERTAFLVDKYNYKQTKSALKQWQENLH